MASARAIVGLYLIPGFPDWAASSEALAAALKAGVDFVEFPIIGRKSWSPRTGSVIARALEYALDGSSLTASRAAAWLGTASRSVGVVYRDSWPEADEWEAPNELLALVSALLLEADVDWEAYATQAQEWAVPLVPTFDGRNGSLSGEERARLDLGDVFAYLSLGSQTGSRDERLEEARAKTMTLKDERPNLPVCAAFGIASASDAREVLEKVGCDGVVIGTAALAALEEGLPQYKSWLRSVVRAARREVAVR
jgi:tryptophan synthase alpha subunit